MTNSNSTQHDKKFHIILNWIGREGLQFMQTLNDTKQSKYRKSVRLKYLVKYSNCNVMK